MHPARSPTLRVPRMPCCCKEQCCKTPSQPEAHLQLQQMAKQGQHAAPLFPLLCAARGAQNRQPRQHVAPAKLQGREWGEVCSSLAVRSRTA